MMGENTAGLVLLPPTPERLEKYARFADRFEQARQLHTGEAPKRAPAPVITTTQAGNPTVSPERIKPVDPLAVLSPSKANTFMDCGAKFFYRSVLGLPETRSAASALGTAVHDATAANYRQKIETKRDLPTEGALAVFRVAFDREIAAATLEKGDDVADLRGAGEVITRVYMDQIAPRVQPAAVELHVEGLIGDVPVQGFIDVLTTDGEVIDLKTAKRKPAGVPASYRLQVATYAMLAPGASGRARLDTFAKTKTIQHVSNTVQIGDGDRKYTTRLYSIVREQMQTGLYAPNRASNLCSRKYCAHWQRCVEDYGGEVKA